VDIIVCLDPGHHPDRGAVGPSGLEEREVNLAVATELRKSLERRGAIVVMTREEDEGISLRARPKLAAAVRADLLISIHFNALPDGVNPWRNNGSSVYYFHPMSNSLARSIHEAVLAELGLPDFGIYYANLALCRPTQMISVLTEEAFMMIPEQEMLLSQPDFQRRCATAIFKGLKTFLKRHR
jgi:N-acetylmuramoyl-L-alanine amidase